MPRPHPQWPWYSLLSLMAQASGVPAKCFLQKNAFDAAKVPAGAGKVIGELSLGDTECVWKILPVLPPWQLRKSMSCLASQEKLQHRRGVSHLLGQRRSTAELFDGGGNGAIDAYIYCLQRRILMIFDVHIPVLWFAFIET